MGEGEERRTHSALMRSGYVWERGTTSQCDLNVVKCIRVKCISQWERHLFSTFRLFIYKHSVEKDSSFKVRIQSTGINYLHGCAEIMLDINYHHKALDERIVYPPPSLSSPLHV